MIQEEQWCSAMCKQRHTCSGEPAGGRRALSALRSTSNTTRVPSPDSDLSKAVGIVLSMDAMLGRFNAVGVVFLRPWWSRYVAEDSKAKMFELEAVEATSASIRPLFREAKPPFSSVEVKNCDSDKCTSNERDDSILRNALPGKAREKKCKERLLITVPRTVLSDDGAQNQGSRDKKKLMLRIRKPVLDKNRDVASDDATVKVSEEDASPKPPLAPRSENANEHFFEAMRIARALVDYANKHLNRDSRNTLDVRDSLSCLG